MKEIKFTSDQLDALDVSKRDTDACIVAGPGSGKTTVLVEYFKRLVAADVDPLRILAITFTEKAAANMRQKLAEVYRDDLRARAHLERGWISTVHGFCARLLREHAISAGIDPEFRVADERESRRMQQQCISDAIAELFRDRREDLLRLIRGLATPEFEGSLLSAYDAMRGAGVSVEDLAGFPRPRGCAMRDVALALEQLSADPAEGWKPAQKAHLDEIIEATERIASAPAALDALRGIEVFPANLRKCKSNTPACELVRRLRDETLKDVRYWLISEHYARERDLLIEAMRRFDRLYRERKRHAGTLDFADLEEYAVRLLRNPAARMRVQQQFDYVLMDEYQDTNPQQANLVELLRRPGRFYAVGDINQSIFGFRHAEPDVFRQYRDSIRTSGRVVELEGNFRSRTDILLAVETVAKGSEGLEPRRLTAGRDFSGNNDEPPFVEFMHVLGDDMESALGNEARWLARRILELGTAFGKIAVLVRNTKVIGAFTAAFELAGIPYVVSRGRGFYESREVCDLVNLLRVIANSRDEIALAAVLRSPLVGVSANALLQLRLAGESMAAALQSIGLKRLETGVNGDGDALQFDPADMARLLKFRDRLQEWRERREHTTFDRLLQAAMDESGYLPESGSGAANIEKFLAYARDAAAEMSLDEFVEELELLRESNREPDAPPDDDAEAVRIMTAHSAKGLEFPVVFVAAMHKGVESEPPVIAFSPAIGLGARWRNPASRKEKERDKDDLFRRALRTEREKREREESNRLLYVAMTRAEERLVLSYSSVFGKKTGNWAVRVAEALEAQGEEACDEVVVREAPGGESWPLRVLVTGEAPLLEPVSPAIRAGEDVEYLDRPARGGQYDGNAAVTALSAYAKCPRAYYLGRYLGFAPPAHSVGGARGITAAELGTQVHALLAGCEVPEADSEAIRLEHVFRQSPLGRRVARGGRAEREFDFLLALEDVVIRGQVDLWFEESGELVVVDYKTDDVTRAQAHERAEDYALQLRLYCMAVERAAGRPPDRAWVHFLRPDVAVEIDLTPSLLQSPESVVREFRDAQDSLDFPARESASCARCAFARDLCPKG